MHNLTVIYRHTCTNLSRDLAERICEHSISGKIAVITDKPTSLLSATKKQLAGLIRRLQRERASTLNSAKISDLNQQIVWAQRLSFTAKEPGDFLEATVTFGTVDSFARVPPLCSTLYVTHTLDKEKLYMLTGWMPKGSAVIIYGNG
jgi:hypothetical protein